MTYILAIVTKEVNVMTGKELIKAIQDNNLEDLEIFCGELDCVWPYSWIEFSVSDDVLPFPEFRDVDFPDEEAHISKYKVLTIDRDKNVECVDRILDTSKHDD